MEKKKGQYQGFHFKTLWKASLPLIGYFSLPLECLWQYLVNPAEWSLIRMWRFSSSGYEFSLQKLIQLKLGKDHKLCYARQGNESCSRKQLQENWRHKLTNSLIQKCLAMISIAVIDQGQSPIWVFCVCICTLFDGTQDLWTHTHTKNCFIII